MKFKNFKAFGLDSTRIALTSGHVYVLNKTEWRPIPEFAWGACYAAQCMSEDMVTNNNPRLVKEQIETTQNKALVRRAVIKTLMYEFYEKQPNFFDKTGYPNLRRLNTMCDFKITSSERRDIWDEVKDELP